MMKVAAAEYGARVCMFYVKRFLVFGSNIFEK